MNKVMEHFDQVYNKLTGQIGQKWMTGSDGTTNAAASYHAKSNCVEPIMQNLLEKSSFEMVKVKNERMHPFPSSLSDLFSS